MSLAAELGESRRRQRSEQAHLAGREGIASWARLAIFLATLVAIIGAWPGPTAVALWLLAGVALFVISVRVHQRLRVQRERADRVLLVLDEAARRAGGVVTCVRGWARPEDQDQIDALLPVLEPPGSAAALTEQERDDLDLYSRPVGIFGLLNRTSTAIGARRLRDRIDAPLLDAGRIVARQGSVQWLEQHLEARLRIMGALARLRDEDRRAARFIEAVATIAPLQLPVPLSVARIWSIFSALAFLTVTILAVAVDANLGWLLGGLLPVNTGIYLAMRAAFSAAIERWKDTAWAVAGFGEALERLAGELPAEAELGRLKRCAADAIEGRRLQKIGARAAWAESGGLVHFLFNIVAFHELHIAASLIGLTLPARDKLLHAISAAAEVEFLCSLACFAAEQPLRSYPTPTNDGSLAITGGVHPLVAPERVIANDLRLDPRLRIWVITGSNMAGKSTFLRMAGVSVVLAQLGGAVTAREMHWQPLRLITDLRARDNLAESESYFLSEVRHLRRLIAPPPPAAPRLPGAATLPGSATLPGAASPPGAAPLPDAPKLPGAAPLPGATPLLGLIDEPFRGTNSQDQSAASVAVVKHLLAAGPLVLLATHDRNLTLLADGAAASNYHFRENLGAAGMVFDYRLHEGPATTRNALRILEIEGYPAALLDAAHAWLTEAAQRG